MANKLNKEILSKIAHRSKTAEAVFGVLAVRDRAREDTDLRRLKNRLIDEGFRVVPAEFLETFKELDRAGVGRLVQKAGEPPRFRWNYNLKEVGRLGFNGAPSKPPSEPDLPKAKPNHSTTVVILAEGRTASFQIPLNLEKEEADLLCRILLQRTKTRIP